MLHILWMILKIILLLLGIVLGLVLLALLLVLFCPVRYRAEAEGKLEDWKNAQAAVTVSWLFRAVLLRIRLIDGTPSFGIRILGIPLEKLRGRKNTAKNKKKKPEQKKPEQKKPEQKKPEQKKPEQPKPEQPKPEQPKPEQPKQQKPEQPKPEQDPAGKTESQETETSQSFLSRIRTIISGFSGKLRKIPEKIRRIFSNVQEIYGKISSWKQFLSHPKVREAVSYVWKYAKYLLKHIAPVKVEGKAVFGCDDPSITGMVLAVLGMTFPFHKNRLEITPVFGEGNQLEGEIKLRGRIYGVVLAVMALQIYFNKNIKYVISRWKHKEEMV